MVLNNESSVVWKVLPSGTPPAFACARGGVWRTSYRSRFEHGTSPGRRMEHPAPGSTRSLNCINCTNADVRLRTPDDGQKDCPKHAES